MVSSHHRQIRIVPSARAEYADAARWYTERDGQVAMQFVEAAETALHLIALGPYRWPERLHGTRRYVLTRFPYEVIYRANEEVITVFAIAHTRRKPGYWRHRL